MAEDFIWIVNYDNELKNNNEPAERNIKEINENLIQQINKVPAEKLKSNFKSFFQNITNITDGIPEKKSSFVLDEIEISVEISGEGTFKIIGNGAKAGAKGGITFKLKRIDK